MLLGQKRSFWRYKHFFAECCQAVPFSIWQTGKKGENDRLHDPIFDTAKNSRCSPPKLTLHALQQVSPHNHQRTCLHTPLSSVNPFLFFRKTSQWLLLLLRTGHGINVAVALPMTFVPVCLPRPMRFHMKSSTSPVTAPIRPVYYPKESVYFFSIVKHRSGQQQAWPRFMTTSPKKGARFQRRCNL
jgi:hypothetical protein